MNKDSNSAGQPPMFSLSMGARPSLFSSSEVQTESTAMDSMFSGSLVGSLGKASFVDFSMSIGRRTSIAKNLQRRRTEIVEDIRESEGSLNDRGSALDQQHDEEEGNVNQIQSSIKVGGKCFSDVKIEEHKDHSKSKSASDMLDSHRSGSGSGRLHNVIGSFVDPADNNEEDPFASDSFPAVITSSEHLKNFNELEEYDCDAGDTDEHGPKQIPFETSHSAVQNRNHDTIGRSKQ